MGLGKHIGWNSVVIGPQLQEPESELKLRAIQISEMKNVPWQHLAYLLDA